MQQIFRKVGQNTGILFIVNIIGSVIGFLMAAALGRGLGDAGFGQYSFVMTWLLSLTLFTEFGLSTVLTRDLAATPKDTPHYLVNALVAKSILSLPGAALLLLFAPALTPNNNPAVVAALQWGIIFFYSSLIFSTFTAIFKAHQNMTPILWLTLSGQIVLFGGTLLLLLIQQPLFTIIAWAGMSQSLQCVMAFFFYRKVIIPHPNPLPMGEGTHALSPLRGIEGEPRQTLNPTIMPKPMPNITVGVTPIKRLLIKAWPFALAGFLAAIQLRANILILAYLQGDQAIGWYSAANRFVETGKQLPGAFYAALLPALAFLAEDAGQSYQLQTTLRQARLGLFLFGAAASLGAFVLARPVLTLTYGAAYQPATHTLQILTLTLIPAAQNSISILYLYARHDERFVNLLMTLGIAVNLTLCFWFIPLWGPAGTALALLVAESVLYFPYRHRVKTYV